MADEQNPSRSQPTPVEVPPAALPYDAVGIRPLYGDGYYAVGHLRPLNR